jgi:hypothetical protein
MTTSRSTPMTQAATPTFCQSGHISTKAMPIPKSLPDAVPTKQIATRWQVTELERKESPTRLSVSNHSTPTPTTRYPAHSPGPIKEGLVVDISILRKYYMEEDP